MTEENSSTGLSPVLWVIAAIMFLGILNRDGFGGLHSFIGPMLGAGLGNLGNSQNLNNDCINNKNVLDTVIATSSALGKEVNAIQQQNTANWYNTNQHIDNLFAKQQEEKIFDLKMQSMQKDNQILQLQSQMYNQDQFNRLHAQMGLMQCEMLKKPPVFGAGYLPAVSCGLKESISSSSTTPAA